MACLLMGNDETLLKLRNNILIFLSFFDKNSPQEDKCVGVCSVVRFRDSVKFEHVYLFNR